VKKVWVLVLLEGGRSARGVGMSLLLSMTDKMRFNATWTGTAVRKQNGLVMQLVECKTENTMYIPDHEIVPLQLLGASKPGRLGR